MIFLFFAVAFLLLILVSGVYVFVAACVRKREIPWLIKEEIEKTPFGEHYDSVIHADRWLRDHNAVDTWIKSDDGLQLHGLWVPVDQPRGTVLFAHGYRSSYLVDIGQALDFYHSRGMNLLIPDQRSHGKSEGCYITFGVKESRDMMRWLEYHNKNYGLIPVVLTGLSMGASTMLYLADQELPSNVRCMIADCGFTSPKAILSKVFHGVTHLPASICLWVTDLCARLFAGFSLGEKDTRKILANSKLPILIIHGTDDHFVPCEMSKEAYAACTDPKELFLVEGAGHGVSFLVAREAYIARVEHFLEKYI